MIHPINTLIEHIRIQSGFDVEYNIDTSYSSYDNGVFYIQLTSYSPLEEMNLPVRIEKRKIYSHKQYYMYSNNTNFKINTYQYELSVIVDEEFNTWCKSIKTINKFNL